MPSRPFASALKPAGELFKRLSTIQPKEAKLTIGLDVGSTAVKVVALGPRKGAGARAIIGYKAASLDAGQDADASEAIKTAMASLMLPVQTVNLSVSGPWVIMRIVEMPTMKPTEMKQALPFEAQRYLPFNIQDVIIDGAVLGPVDANKSWVLIVACKKELIDRRIDAVKRAGLEAGLIDVDALAVANAYLAQDGAKPSSGTRALINIGAQLTNLVIFQGEIPYLVRDIPWGGEKFARAVAEQIGGEVQAVTEMLARSEPNADLMNAMKPACEPLVTELQLSFDYFENRFNQPPEELLASGGVSQVPGAVEAIKSHLTQSVSAWSPVKGLSGQFAVAYGLALRTS